MIGNIMAVVNLALAALWVGCYANTGQSYLAGLAVLSFGAFLMGLLS